MGCYNLECSFDRIFLYLASIYVFLVFVESEMEISFTFFVLFNNVAFGIYINFIFVWLQH